MGAVVRSLLLLVIIIELLTVIMLIFFPSFFYDLSAPGFHCRGCNVLLITMDALRADHVGAYGYQRNTTPNIDTLAKNGVMFENYIVSGSITDISLPSIMASMLPALSKIDDDHVYVFVPDNKTTLAELLKLNGYFTSAVINNDINFSNVFQGFDSLSISDFVDDSLVASKVLASLEKHKSDKFFLWVHFISPHTPYRPPYPFNETFFNDSFYDSSRKIDFYVPDFPKDANLNSSEIDYYISQYDGEIRFIDDYVGKFIALLNDSDILENTLIIISSDHGEILAEHDSGFGHGYMYEEELKPPLIIFNPKSKVTGSFHEQIRGIDLYPTIVDILGLNLFPRIDGASFYDLIVGKQFIELVAYSSGYLDDHKSVIFAFRTNRWKYIHGPIFPELYDLSVDPHEDNNLFEDYESLRSFIDPELVSLIDSQKSDS